VRIKVSLYARRGEVLDYNHCYELAREIRRAIKTVDPEILSDEASRLYTFSRIMVKNRSFELCRDGMKLLTSQLYFFFSSLSKNICDSLIDGFVELRRLNAGGISFEVSKIEVIKESKITGNEKLVTLSPINFRDRSCEDADFEEKFTEKLTKELIRRYTIIYGSNFDGDVRFKVLKCKSVAIRVGGKKYRAHLMVFNAHGSKKLIEIGYKSGFGTMTDCGFGMVKKAKRI